jgi:hypothetical protein
MTHVTLSLSVPLELLELVEANRGRLPRSAYISSKLSEVMETKAK